MASRNPQSTAQIAGHPLHPMLIPFPVAFLVATLVCDLIFWRTGNSSGAPAIRPGARPRSGFSGRP